MVDKKSPVMRQTVAKSTRAPRSKKLNLDKLLTSIKNISTRYKRNGKMTGGDIDGFKNVKTEIEKFFMTTTALNSNTAFQNMLDDILKIKSKGIEPDSEFTKLVEKINTLITPQINNEQPTTAIAHLFSINNNDIEYVLNVPDKKQRATRIANRIAFFNSYQVFPILNPSPATDTFKKDLLLKKALSYISLLQIATTLAIIHKFINDSS
jgi:hypothetical protein